MMLLGLGDIDEKNMHFSLQAYFRQMWKDPRLMFRSALCRASVLCGPVTAIRLVTTATTRCR